MDLFFSTSVDEFSQRMDVTKALLLIFLSGFALIRVSEEVEPMIFRNSKFWFLTASLLYFSGSLLVFCLENQIIKSNMSNQFWAIHSLCNIFTNILFSISLLCNSKHKMYS